MATQSLPTWTTADRLRKARETAGIKVEQMAELMLSGRNSITNWEHGHTRPTARKINRWAEITGVPVWWLEGLDTNPDQDDSRSRWLGAA